MIYFEVLERILKIVGTTTNLNLKVELRLHCSDKSSHSKKMYARG